MPPQVRGPGWTNKEKQSALNSINRYLPDCVDDWRKVEFEHGEMWEGRNRTVKSIQKVFKDFHSPAHPPTGDPNPSENTVWARAILASIREKGQGTTGSSHPDDSLEDRGEVVDRDLAVDDDFGPHEFQFDVDRPEVVMDGVIA